MVSLSLPFFILNLTKITPTRRNTRRMGTRPLRQTKRRETYKQQQKEHYSPSTFSVLYLLLFTFCFEQRKSGEGRRGSVKRVVGSAIFILELTFLQTTTTTTRHSHSLTFNNKQQFTSNNSRPSNMRIRNTKDRNKREEDESEASFTLHGLHQLQPTEQ